MAVDTNHEAFSSAEGIGLPNRKAMEEQRKAMEAMGIEPRRGGGAGFITMDEPEHGPQRKAVSPTLAPANIAKMAPVVRERAGQILEFAADRRGVRLGRPGVEGTDGDDARHPVRLPVRAAAQAALVVGHDHEPARPRPGGELAAEGGGDPRVLQRLQRAVEPARQRRARHRPDLDAGAQPGHPEHGRGRVPRERRPADRRRQRHHPQHHLRQRLCAEQEPRPVRQAARQPGPGAADGLRDHPLADAAGPHAPHRHARHRARRQDHQGRATTSPCGTSPATATRR